MSEPIKSFGSWHYVESDSSIYDDNGRIVLAIDPNWPCILTEKRISEINRAARLAAAAPELLAAIQNFLATKAKYGSTFGNLFDREMQAMEDSIAKALSKEYGE